MTAWRGRHNLRRMFEAARWWDNEEIYGRPTSTPITTLANKYLNKAIGLRGQASAEYYFKQYCVLRDFAIIAKEYNMNEPAAVNQLLLTHWDTNLFNYPHEIPPWAENYQEVDY